MVHRMKQSIGEAMLALHLKAHKIRFEAEHRFYSLRKWRFDFVIYASESAVMPSYAVEIDGGNRMAAIIKGRAVAIGRHTQDDDYEKLNAATIDGWKVLRFTPAMVKSGAAIDTILRALGRK
jgi:very-short-patch-repair endonuclease